MHCNCKREDERVCHIPQHLPAPPHVSHTQITLIINTHYLIYIHRLSYGRHEPCAADSGRSLRMQAEIMGPLKGVAENRCLNTDTLCALLQLSRRGPSICLQAPDQQTASCGSKTPHHVMWRGCSAFRLMAWMPFAPAHSPAHHILPRSARSCVQAIASLNLHDCTCQATPQVWDSTGSQPSRKLPGT